MFNGNVEGVGHDHLAVSTTFACTNSGANTNQHWQQMWMNVFVLFAMKVFLVTVHPPGPPHYNLLDLYRVRYTFDVHLTQSELPRRSE